MGNMENLYEHHKYMSQDKLADTIANFLTYNTNFSPLDLARHLTKEGFIRREKAKLISPTWIQGRRFENIYHCSFCNGIPYGGVGEDSHFCMVCGAEIEEIV